MNTTDQAIVESILFAEPLPFKVAKIFLYVMILVFGTVGNTVIILIICKIKHVRKTPGNLFILNLAVCDLLTPLISIPFDFVLVESNYKWYLGPVVCKVLPPAITFIATSSSLTLAAISLDRYRTLLHPFKQRLDARKVKMLIALVHVCSGILVLPHIVTLELSSSGYCAEVWPSAMLPKIYTLILFLGQYALPLGYMAVMYIFAAKSLFASTQRARLLSIHSTMSTGKGSRSGSRNGSVSLNGWVASPDAGSSHDSLERHFRKESEHNAQVTKMFIVIVVVFAVMTLPLEVSWLWRDFGGGDKNRYQPIIAVVCRLFTYANSCFNPIIFYNLSRDFHKGFLAFFNGCAPCCGDDSALKRAQLGATNGSGTWDRGMRTYTPSWLTPRGSFQSNHSVSFADQVKLSHDNKEEQNLSAPRFDHKVHNKSLAIDMFHRILINKEITNRKADMANSSYGSSMLKVASTCTDNTPNSNCNISINVYFCEGDITIELGNLESLTVLPQTDC